MPRKEYRDRNKDHVRQYEKDYRKAKPETERAKKKRWNDANKEKTRMYYEANREKILARQKARYEWLHRS